MHNLPLTPDASKQEGLIAPIVNFPTVGLDHRNDLNIRNRPRKRPYDMRFNIRKVQLQPVQRAALGFHVMINQIA